MSVQACLALMITTVAVCMDVMREKVENSWIVLSWILGLGYQIGAEGIAGAGCFFAGVLIPILFLYPLFRFRMIGAGDIKLLSAVGGFMDFSAICWCMFCSFLIGAALSAAVLATCGDFSRRLRYFSRYFHNYFQTGKVVPYRKYGMQPEHIHFSVPVFLSVLLYAGGIYG